MEVYLAADHNGYEMKNKLREWLKEEGYVVQDLGPEELNMTDDYPDFAAQVAKKVAEQPEKRRGILLCGSGVGMAMAAGKVKGIRAALVHDPAIAKAAREDDNVNVLALGAEYISDEAAKAVINEFLETKFAGEERFTRRLEKITQLESYE
jgi:ribose 5-phosphate isomerase B